ncbi:MAG: transposase [Acidobacteriota bacterium]
MARKARAEVAGGLYHVITRGNNRRQIFNSQTDYQKFLSLLAVQKGKLPFFLYAYCLMPNHLHLLIERQADRVGHIMHRVLTGYTQYYNRRYRRVGHLLQGRHKAILCQSDRYLTELVRYIHLNPVRAGMVEQPEQYEYSGHRAYLGLEPTGLVDIDPVLRHFGVKKEIARARYGQFVRAGMKLGHQEEFYLADEGRILGSEEFVEATIHRIGEVRRIEGSQPKMKLPKESFSAEDLLAAVEEICEVKREEFCGPGKHVSTSIAKELFVLAGCQMGASLKQLSDISGMSSAAISRRKDAGRARMREDKRVAGLVSRIVEECRQRIVRSEA